MNRLLSKVAASSFFLVISLFNEIQSFAENAKKFGLVNIIENMHIQWGDLLFRIILTSFVWWFYRDYLRLRTEAKLLREKIFSLRAITRNDDHILMELWKESRDRHDNNLKLIAQELGELTGKNIVSKPENPEITKFKNMLNDKMEVEIKHHEHIVDKL